MLVVVSIRPVIRVSASQCGPCVTAIRHGCSNTVQYGGVERERAPSDACGDREAGGGVSVSVSASAATGANVVPRLVAGDWWLVTGSWVAGGWWLVVNRFGQHICIELIYFTPSPKQRVRLAYPRPRPSPLPITVIGDSHSSIPQCRLLWYIGLLPH